MTNTGALIGKVFPGKVESFSVFRVLFAFGTVITILLNIMLDGVEGWVFLVVIMMIQVIASGVSTQIMDLREKTKSLVSQ